LQEPATGKTLWQTNIAIKIIIGPIRVFSEMLWAEVDLIKGLTFRTNFGLDYTNSYNYYMNKKNLEFSESAGNNFSMKLLRSISAGYGLIRRLIMPRLTKYIH